MFCLCVWIECVGLAWGQFDMWKGLFSPWGTTSCVQMRCMYWPSVVVWMAVSTIGIFFLLYDWVFFLLRVAIKFVQIAGFPLSSRINQLFCQTDMCTYKLLWHHSIRLDDTHHYWELVKSTQIWHSFELLILTFVGDLDYLVCTFFDMSSWLSACWGVWTQIAGLFLMGIYCVHIVLINKGDVTKESLHQVSSQ